MQIVSWGDNLNEMLSWYSHAVKNAPFGSRKTVFQSVYMVADMIFT